MKVQLPCVPMSDVAVGDIIQLGENPNRWIKVDRIEALPEDLLYIVDGEVLVGVDGGLPYLEGTHPRMEMVFLDDETPRILPAAQASSLQIRDSSPAPSAPRRILELLSAALASVVSLNKPGRL